MSSDATVWYPADIKRDYASIMLAWLGELKNCPTTFPAWAWDPRGFIPAMVPVLDAHIRADDHLTFMHDGFGGWLGMLTLRECALFTTAAADRQARELAGSAGLHLITWHRAGGPNTLLQPWRLFTTCPPIETSRAATRRQAKVLAAFNGG